MRTNDLCQYVDVFYGNGETDRFFEEGLASKWFYIKALCGNTVPHATLPFGKMSVGAYSGGYPTGYGTHYPNFCGGIKKLSENIVARGFSHFHHCGTGAIRYYYNYAVVCPFYGNLENAQEYRTLNDERAHPGYYSASLDDTLCELTVNGGVALHRYRFKRRGGRVMIDFSSVGLREAFGEQYHSTVKDASIEILSSDELAFSGEFYGVRLYFFVQVISPIKKLSIVSEGKQIGGQSKSFAFTDEFFGAVFDLVDDEFLLKLSYSTVSAQKAREAARETNVSFDEAAEQAYACWNEHLGAIRIECANEELKRKFYSNLYHSIVKPCDLTGERILGVEGDVVSDFATFWDQYKTALPLVYTCYPEMASSIVRGILNISRTLGKIPCSFGMSDVFPCEEQAKMLGVLSLCDAFHLGTQGVDRSVIEECIQRELSREDFKPFIQNGVFARYTHIIDVTDACLAVSEITENAELKSKLLALASAWTHAYGDDGLMSGNSQYYEGDRYTYSFRIQKNMQERVRLAGGKARFAELLDAFFGFGAEKVKQLTYVGAAEEIGKTHYHRFQGFNNECDMEAPYAYIYADRHDRLCEIVRECVHRSFGVGKGALAGNNDSGGLSSTFVWNALGIFPASGCGEFLIGSPQIDTADIRLSSGRTLHIRVSRSDAKDGIYVDRVELNGKPVEGYRIAMRELMKGGQLHFHMK